MVRRLCSPNSAEIDPQGQIRNTHSVHQNDKQPSHAFVQLKDAPEFPRPQLQDGH
jgi:hypothetical protein